MELADFLKGKDLRMEDFQLETPDVLAGPKAASSIAANSAMTADGDPVDAYDSLRQSLLSQEDRQTFLLEQERKRQMLLQDGSEEFLNILRDETLNLEQHTAAALGLKELATSPVNERQVLSETYLAADSEDNDGDRVETSRLKMADAIAGVNKRKAKMQSMINEVMLESNPSLASKAVDLAELMAPFAEWGNTEAIWKEVLDKGEFDTRLLGNLKDDLTKAREAIPIDQREEWAARVVEIIKEHEDVLFPDGNDLTKAEFLQNILISDDYSDTEKFFDNFTSVLDVVGLGGMLRAAVKFGKGAKATKTLKASKELSEATAKVVKGDPAPVSVVENLKDVNPAKTRAMVQAVEADETGQAAEALAGVSRDDALASVHLPEVDVSGAVKHKTQLDISPSGNKVIELSRTKGSIELTDNEINKITQAVKTDLENVQGLNLRKESLSIKTSDKGGLSIKAIYTPWDAGFKTYNEAIENAEFGFRHLGLTKDDFVIMQRNGDEWVPTSQKDMLARDTLVNEFRRRKKKMPDELKEPIDYAISIDFNMAFDPGKLDAFDILSVKRNWLDRLDLGFGKSRAGSLTQHLLDSASVLHPQIVNAASVAVDRSAGLRKAMVDEFDNFAKKYAKLPTDRRGAMTDYINEANYNGLKLDRKDLIRRGFDEDEIQLLKEWRQANDMMFTMMNEDVVRNMKARGYRVYVDNSSNTELFVRPLKRENVSPRYQLLDSVTGDVKTLSKDELDDLYEKGGNISVLDEPQLIGDETVEYIINRESPKSGYSRVFRDDDKVLNYRDGYYPVMYDAEFFITKTITRSDGSTYEKAIATAKTENEAKNLVANLLSDKPDQTISYRRDRRAKPGDIADHAVSASINAGLSAQRYRGQKLFDADSLTKPGYANLVDPLEAVAQQVRSLSSRVSMRDYLNTTKERWISNYSKYLDTSDLTTKGRVGFPQSRDQIKGVAGADPKMVADAKTLFSYINTLENGYINSIDETYSALLMSMSDQVAKVNKGKLDVAERFLNTSATGNPTRGAKSAAFKLYLALNPLRQLVIQAHQNVQLLALEPSYVLSGGLAKDYYNLKRIQYGVNVTKEDEALLAAWNRSGLSEAVDTNNLIRDDMLRLADTTTWQKTKSTLNAPVKVSQKVGFDVAEQSVLMMSWLTHRHRAIQAGKELNPRTYDEIAGQARAFTFNMNAAGDMPYNQNFMNVALQFLQVPHKALLQPLTNRSLSRSERARLLAFNTAMYGVPAGSLSTLYTLMEPGVARDTIEHGMEDVLLNALINSVTDGQTNLDFGDLAPVEMGGMLDMFVTMATDPLGGVISESPSGALLFGSNPRVTDVFKTTLRWFHIVDDYEDPALNTDFKDVTLAFANLSSGWSNAFKGAYALQSGKKMSSTGKTVVESATTAEAIATIFGFRTKEEESRRVLQERMYGGSKYSEADMQADIGKWYSELKRQLARRGMSIQEREWHQRTLNEAWRVWGTNEVAARKHIWSLIQKDLKNGDDQILKDLMNQMDDLHSMSDLRRNIELYPDESVRRELRKTLRKFEEAMKQ